MNYVSAVRPRWYRFIQGSFTLLAVALSTVGLVGPSSVLAEPAISSIQANQITATTAVISWTTDVASDSFISYIGAGDTEPADQSDDQLVTSHTLTLTGLKPSTVYSFTVNSADAEGENTAINGTDFTTLAGTTSPNPPAPVPPAPTPGGGLEFSDDGGSPPPTGGLPYEAPEVVTPVYPTGTLAKEGGAIYFLMGRDQVKIPFTSMAVFTGLGYKLGNVQSLDLSAFRVAATYILNSATQQHPWGSVLEHKGTLYYSHETGMVGITSMEIFAANGLETGMILPMNAADVAVLENNPALPVLEEHDARLK